MRLTSAQLLLLSLIACSGASPDPAYMAEHIPTAEPVDAETAAANRAATADASERLAAGDFAAARKLSERVVQSDPSDGRARAIRATCLAEEARQSDPPDLVLWRRAEGELRRADELAPDDILVALLHARFLQSDGHLTAGVLRIEELLEVWPDSVEALRLAGELRYDIGDEKLAIAHLSRLAELDPADAQSTWRLADARLRLASTEVEREQRLQRLQEAIEGYKRYQELEPDDISGWLGEAYARHLSWDEQKDGPSEAQLAAVLALYTEAARVAPKSPEPAFGRAVVLERVGDVEGAELAYREALQLDGGYVPGLLNLAALLADQERVEEARALALKALEQELPVGDRRRLEDFLRQDQS